MIAYQWKEGQGLNSTDCRHHWRLPSPSGPTITATCKLCGAQREYLAGLADEYAQKEWKRDEKRGETNTVFPTRQGMVD